MNLWVVDELSKISADVTLGRYTLYFSLCWPFIEKENHDNNYELLSYSDSRDVIKLIKSIC